MDIKLFYKHFTKEFFCVCHLQHWNHLNNRFVLLHMIYHIQYFKKICVCRVFSMNIKCFCKYFSKEKNCVFSIYNIGITNFLLLCTTSVLKYMTPFTFFIRLTIRLLYNLVAN
jgi:hypothetical protein